MTYKSCFLALIVLILSINGIQAAKKTYKALHAAKHMTGAKWRNITRRAFLRFEKFNVMDIPNSFDLRSNLSPIEDQGQCGSCWAFSLTALHRDGQIANGYDAGPLSQQYLVDCAAEAFGCNGGFFDAADYITYRRKGIQGSPLSSVYPYEAATNNCRTSEISAYRYISDWKMLGGVDGPSVKDIQAQMVISNKPVSITVAAGAGDWSAYSSGVYNGCTMGDQIDHMINIVGWDNEGATHDANGNLPPNVGIWILRNSWGTGWGENGWMRTKMTDAAGNRCNRVAQEAASFSYFEDTVSTTTTIAPTDIVTDAVQTTTSSIPFCTTSTCIPPTTTVPVCIPTTQSCSASR